MSLNKTLTNFLIKQALATPNDFQGPFAFNRRTYPGSYSNSVGDLNSPNIGTPHGPSVHTSSNPETMGALDQRGMPMGFRLSNKPRMLMRNQPDPMVAFNEWVPKERKATNTQPGKVPMENLYFQALSRGENPVMDGDMLGTIYRDRENPVDARR